MKNNQSWIGATTEFEVERKRHLFTRGIGMIVNWKI